MEGERIGENEMEEMKEERRWRKDERMRGAGEEEWTGWRVERMKKKERRRWNRNEGKDRKRRGRGVEGK